MTRPKGFFVFTIKELSENTKDGAQTIQAVADIEAAVQLQEAWTYQTINELLEQDSIRLMVAVQSIDSSIESNACIVGYCLYQLIFEQAEILRIGTHPDYQRQGCASKLFFELYAQLQAGKVADLLLEVRADNVPAISLYERQGFRTIHRRKGYYHSAHKPAVDALVMQRKIG